MKAKYILTILSVVSLVLISIKTNAEQVEYKDSKTPVITAEHNTYYSPKEPYVSIQIMPEIPRTGIYGTSNHELGAGVLGAGLKYGVYGFSQKFFGVYGNGPCGVLGDGTLYGVYGNSEKGVGIYGKSKSKSGVYGKCDESSGIGVEGWAYGKGTGVQGTSTNGYGVYGNSPKGYGLYGYSTENIGIYGKSNNLLGVVGEGKLVGILGKCLLEDGFAIISDGNLHVNGNLTVTGDIKFEKGISKEKNLTQIKGVKVTASSEYNINYKKENVIDLKINRWDEGEWATKGGKPNPENNKTWEWIQLDFPKPVNIKTVRLYDRPNEFDKVIDGWLLIKNKQGELQANIHFGILPYGGAFKEIPLTETEGTNVTSLKVVITKASPTTYNVGLSEIELY